MVEPSFAVCLWCGRFVLNHLRLDDVFQTSQARFERHAKCHKRRLEVCALGRMVGRCVHDGGYAFVGHIGWVGGGR